ncbi:MAG: helicase-related protein [Desulfotignum sp.]|nr:hypothetical protein [Desulfobacteraceae bacterium]
MYPVSQTGKRTLLSGLIRDGNWHQTLVFTRTKHRANRLTKQLLSDGITAAAIHGNKSQAGCKNSQEEYQAAEQKHKLAALRPQAQKTGSRLVCCITKL